MDDMANLRQCILFVGEVDKRTDCMNSDEDAYERKNDINTF